MVDNHPGLILRCNDTKDVAAAVQAARTNGLWPAVRGGGHSVSGKGMSHGGLTIDLGELRGVTVDADRRLVHAGGGCLLSDIDEATAAHRLVVPVGTVSETGIGGLALGGGSGWFSRKHGLTCDQIVRLEVVLASGEVVTASSTSHPELFWGLRGGGGNFGVVTRFTFRAHEFGPMMRVGVSLYEPEHAVEALHRYAAISPTLCRDVGWHVMFKDAMPAAQFVPPELVGKRLLVLTAMWLGDPQDVEGAQMIQRLGAVGHPSAATSMVLPFATGVQRMFDDQYPDGRRYYTKEVHLNELADGTIDLLIDAWKAVPIGGELSILGLGGAVRDIPEDAAAFSHRESPMWLSFEMKWDNPANDQDYIAFTRKTVNALQPWLGEGAYVNVLNFDETDRVVEALGGPQKYAKLSRIKTQYDPDNLFRMNYNITPSADPPDQNDS